jgi:hypothetical protein
MSRNGERPGDDPEEGWREPAHLGEGGAPGADRPAGDDPPAAWEPPGWSLPPADDRPTPEPLPEPLPAPVPTGNTVSDGVWGWPTAQEWARGQGWTVADGPQPQETALRELIAAAPVRRLGKDALPAGVARGRAGSVELVAFDVVYDSGRRIDVVYAITAAPVLLPLPRMRLSPARFWKHGVGGLLQLPSGNDEFDSRWVLLTEQDTPELRRVVEDPVLQGLLLGSDDGDEFYTAAGHLAAIRPGKHLAPLVEHHARLLGAVLGALSRV